MPIGKMARPQASLVRSPCDSASRARCAPPSAYRKAFRVGYEIVAS